MLLTAFPFRGFDIIPINNAGFFRTLTIIARRLARVMSFCDTFLRLFNGLTEIKPWHADLQMTDTSYFECVRVHVSVAIDGVSLLEFFEC